MRLVVIDGAAFSPGGRWSLLAICLLLLIASPADRARARPSTDEMAAIRTATPDGAHILDGSFVTNAGELQVNVTNFGLIGSQFTIPSSYCNAPSAQWPAGSGDEYLWAAGLWIGGLIQGTPRVTTGQFESEFRPGPDIEDTMYEAVDGENLRPPGNAGIRGRRQYEHGEDDDGDGAVDEDRLNGYDDDVDGLVDEDFAQIGNQMFVCTMYDNSALTRELYPDHRPMDLRIVQKTFNWAKTGADDFVAFEYQITNIGSQTIEDVYLGFMADCDIGPRIRSDASIDDLAGSYEGFVRSSNGMFNPVLLGYMYDGAIDDPLPGYFGVAIIDHPRDRKEIVAPKWVTLRGFQIFSVTRPYDQGGFPTNDEERYDALSQDSRDPDVLPEHANDYRFLISAGPFDSLAPGETFTFQVALVVGDGFDDLLANTAEVGQILFGSWVDYDGNRYTGRNGRESLVCAEDLAPHTDWMYPNHPIYRKNFYFGDVTCVPFPAGMPNIRSYMLFLNEEGKHCIYINEDNCEECLHRNGQICTPENALIFAEWNCLYSGIPAEDRAGCTGIAGREAEIPWSIGGWPPPSPNLRVWPRDHAVHVYWDNLSECIPDPNSNLMDFESYVVWRSDEWERGPGSSLDYGPPHPTWQTIAQFDLINQFHDFYPTNPGTVEHDIQNLGLNTGLDGIAYVPVCLSDPAFAELHAVMQRFVAADIDGVYAEFPPLYGPYQVLNPGMEEFLPWADHTSVLDTFFAVTPRAGDVDAQIVPKETTRYYEYIDTNVHNGYLYFYSVAATDHEFDTFDNQRYIVGPGREGLPNVAFDAVTPGFAAQSHADRVQFGENIYVYPNPASLTALAEYQQMSPTADDPTGVRITFANLPQAHNTIRVYSLAGDLIKTLEHDGTGGFGQVSWNLVSDNRQQIVSGVYLYAVTSDDRRFEDFVGKFVVIR